MRHKAHDSGNKICSVVAVVPSYPSAYCSVRDWTPICSVNPDSPVHTLSHSLRIYFFSTLESGFKNIRIRCRIRRMLVDGSCIPNKKVTDSEVSFGRGAKLPTHSYIQATVHIK